MCWVGGGGGGGGGVRNAHAPCAGLELVLQRERPDHVVREGPGPDVRRLLVRGDPDVAEALQVKQDGAIKHGPTHVCVSCDGAEGGRSEARASEPNRALERMRAGIWQ